MSTRKVAKASPKSVKKGLAKPDKVQVGKKTATMAQETRSEVVQAAARLAIELHRDALKELERY